MTTDLQSLLGILASIVGIIGYIPYYRDILRGTTKPHPFTWVGFALLLGITFFAQLASNGGPGAWVNGVSAIGVAGIAILALIKGEKHLTLFDWTCFVGSLLAIAAWQLTSNALFAVIIVTIADTIAFIPTFRKAYFKPQEETASLFVWAILKYIISFFALSSVSITNILFPAAIAISNTVFVIMLIVRRRQLDKNV